MWWCVTRIESELMTSIQISTVKIKCKDLYESCDSFWVKLPGLFKACHRRTSSFSQPLPSPVKASDLLLETIEDRNSSDMNFRLKVVEAGL